MRNFKNIEKKTDKQSNVIKNPERKSKHLSLILAKYQNDKNKILKVLTTVKNMNA